MADILSFQDAEKIIKENPKEADALAFEYQKFVEAHPETLPADIPKSVLDGKAISEAYYYLREQHEDEQMRRDGAVDVSKIPADLIGLPVLAAVFLERPKIIQDDKNYQKIEEKLKKEWLEKNNTKDFLSKEGLDYLHGRTNLDPLRTGAGEDSRAEEDWEEAWAKSAGSDLPKTSTLAQDAEKEFRNNPKFQKKTERYDKEAKKVYKKQGDDPGWLVQQRIAQEEISSRIALLEKNQDKKIKLSKEEVGLKESQGEIIRNEIAESVYRKHQEDFVQKHPEKARAYFEKIQAQQRKQEEKTSVSVETSTPQKNPSYITSSPTPAEDQASQPPPSGGRPSGGGINRGINAFNNLASRGVPNPLGRIGSRVAAQGAQRVGAAFFGATAGVWVPILIAVALVLVLTFIIVGFGGAPSSESNGQATNVTPTETITPTIVATQAPTPAQTGP